MTTHRVMIVDDDEQIRRLVTRLLRCDELEVLSAESTVEAERLLANGPVDLLLCDHYMPQENGLPFLQRVKKQYPNVKRVLVTGCSDAGVGVEAINKARVLRCVTKPFDGVELRNLVRELLARRPEPVTGPRRSFTHQRVNALKNLDFDHPGIADVRRNTQGAIVIDDELDDLTKTFDDWSEFEDSREVKTHEDVLNDDFVKLAGT